MYTAKAITPLDYANVRDYPDGNLGRLVGRIYRFQQVRVFETHKNGWHKIGFFSSTTPEMLTGWVFPGVVFQAVETVDETVPPIGDVVYPVSPTLPLNDRNWTGDWYDATGFARYYTATGVGCYHTGADLNRPLNKDAYEPCYAIASGEVLFAGLHLNRTGNPSAWGKLVIIRHGRDRDGVRIRSRYAHLASISIERGDYVQAGQPIGTVGNAEGRYSHHLHFDLSPTNVLDSNPGHWSVSTKLAVITHYIDPAQWLKEQTTQNYG